MWKIQDAVFGHKKKLKTQISFFTPSHPLFIFNLIHNLSGRADVGGVHKGVPGRSLWFWSAYVSWEDMTKKLKLIGSIFLWNPFIFRFLFLKNVSFYFFFELINIKKALIVEYSGVPITFRSQPIIPPPQKRWKNEVQFFPFYSTFLGTFL